MQEKTSQLVKSDQRLVSDDSISSRLLPLAIAGGCCFVVAVLAGTLAWYFLWLPFERPVAAGGAPDVAQTAVIPQQAEAEPESESPEDEAPPVIAEPAAPAGTVAVAAGEIALFGEGDRPLERIFVDGFTIGESEVTNAEYSEFIRETGRTAPDGWSGHKFPSGTDSFPVSNVSWKDAADFCTWKATKLGLPVRLPTEAEWELAARGADQLKYPWGGEWNSDAAISKETGGKISAVKSFPINRSSSGAFDMVGNVWEWVSDDIAESEAVSDEHVESARKQGRRLRLVKGGSAEEPASEMDAQSRYEVPENTRVKVIGFRYVVLPKKSN